MWTYILQPNETLYLLAAKFSIRVTALEATNPGIRLKRLIPGQIIHIPGLPSTTQYTVLPDDNITTICAKFRTDIVCMEKINPGVDLRGMEGGEVLNVPETLDELKRGDGEREWDGESVIDIIEALNTYIDIEAQSPRIKELKFPRALTTTAFEGAAKGSGRVGRGTGFVP